MQKCHFRGQSKAYALLAFSTALSSSVQCQQDEAQAIVKRELTVLPRISVTQNFTNNVALVSSEKRADQITDFSPGIHISRDGRRLKAHFDYALHSFSYWQNTNPNRTQNALDMVGILEAVDSWMFLDFSGNISQQTVSAFGTQSTQNTSPNPNKAEVSNYRISPYLRGRIGSLASYEARLSRALTLSDSAAASNVGVSDTALMLRSESAFKSLGWTGSLSRQSIDYSAGRPTEVDSLSVALIYALNPQLSVRISGGRENGNLTTAGKETSDTSSIGFDWTPSERTRISASTGRRSFGELHSLSVTHRTALTEWRYSDTRDISATPGQSTLSPSNAAVGAPVISSFLSSAVSLQRKQDLSVSLFGARDTITLLASQSESRRFDVLSAASDDLSQSAVEQRGFSASYSHRLAPEYAMTFIASQQRTNGLLSLQETSLQDMSLNLSGKLGRLGKSASASLGIRHSVFRGVEPYEESALSIGLTADF